eukprot:jgi/Ulvmu1/6476/UM003_0107.1
MKTASAPSTASASSMFAARRVIVSSGACQSGSGTRPIAQCSPRGVATFAVMEDATRTTAPDIEAVVLRSGVVDYYSVLQVDDNASEDEIKSAYRQLAKICHPDNAGDKGHNICILLNEAYNTLSNSRARRAYDKQLEVALKDQEDGYTGKELSKWAPTRAPGNAKHEDPAETRAVFVDENSCIGCKNCVWCAAATFRIEPHHGRSRVFGQWLNTEDEIQTAIDSCPVDCIHWVERSELPALEYVCQQLQTRVGVSAMMGQGTGAGDVFGMRDKFLKERRKLDDARRKAQAPSPMQEAARQEAAEALARERGGWLGSLGFRFAQSFATAAAGTAQSGSERDQARSARVGQRKRSVRWNDQVMPGRGGTVPRERALVPVMSKVPDF